MMRVKTLRQWQDPAGGWHDPGEESEIDPAIVFDLDILREIGALDVLSTPAELPPESAAPAKKSKAAANPPQEG
jgi:hypothetical protein